MLVLPTGIKIQRVVYNPLHLSSPPRSQTLPSHLLTSSSVLSPFPISYPLVFFFSLLSLILSFFFFLQQPAESGGGLRVASGSGSPHGGRWQLGAGASSAEESLFSCWFICEFVDLWCFWICKFVMWIVNVDVDDFVMLMWILMILLLSLVRKQCADNKKNNENKRKNFSPGWCYRPGLKMGIFSPRLGVPVTYPGWKGVANRKYWCIPQQCAYASRIRLLHRDCRYIHGYMAV